MSMCVCITVCIGVCVYVCQMGLCACVSVFQYRSCRIVSRRVLSCHVMSAHAPPPPAHDARVMALRRRE